jgi:transposase-like protein
MSSLAGLPPPDTKKWVARRKAAVVAAVFSGKITVEEACQLYQLSEEEFFSWQRAFEAHGIDGLRATGIQRYRDARSSRPGKPASRPSTSTQHGFDSPVAEEA